MQKHLSETYPISDLDYNLKNNDQKTTAKSAVGFRIMAHILLEVKRREGGEDERTSFVHEQVVNTKPLPGIYLSRS